MNLYQSVSEIDPRSSYVWQGLHWIEPYVIIVNYMDQDKPWVRSTLSLTYPSSLLDYNQEENGQIMCEPADNIMYFELVLIIDQLRHF